MKPIWKGTPACSTAATMASVSARERAVGFSQKMALPAWAAATTISRWVLVGVATITAWMAGSASSSW